RQAAEGRHHSHHAKDHPAGKRTPAEKPKMDTKSRLIKTDTLAAGRTWNLFWSSDRRMIPTAKSRQAALSMSFSRS
ncbi:hypothetical protein, partial [Rhizobium lentis]|uniref:hypothetical protein n=1 Tax=Rhizobium lentis TaxID=1138194 RepID=UPI0035C90015